MNTMTLERAYQLISYALLDFAGAEGWEYAASITAIYNRMTESTYRRKEPTGIIENDRFPSFDVAGPASTAILFIRDHILATTGRRIWGLTFTLYPDGRHEITYDYNKPEGYEEADDVITGDDINQSLADLQEQDQSSMTVEQAYQMIGQGVLQAMGDSSWTLGGVDMEYRSGRQVLMRFWQETGTGRVKAPYVPEQHVMGAAANAAYVLHDDLIRNGGTAISSLSMSLTPAGKMKLDYRYPDGDS